MPGSSASGGSGARRCGRCRRVRIGLAVDPISNCSLRLTCSQRPSGAVVGDQVIDDAPGLVIARWSRVYRLDDL